MSDYTDRLRSAAYRSPGGATFTLQFDQVDRSGGKKAAIHELPQQDKVEVQDLGLKQEKFPMSVYFTGNDFDQQADAFWSALSERGPGSLKHPRYGDIPVLPISWSQTEDWVGGVGRADFKVEFVRVFTDVVFPVTAVSATESVTSISAAGVLAATEIAVEDFAPISAADVAVVKAGVIDGLAAYEQAFADIIAVSEQIQAEVTGIINDVTGTIDRLIAAPLALFTSLARLASLPARVVTSIKSKIDSYAAMIQAAASIIPESYAQAVASIQSILSLYGSVAVASTVGPIQSRREAVEIATRLEEISQVVTVAIEQAEDVSFAVATADSPDGYRPDQSVIAELTEAVTVARAAVLERAYSLRAEYTTTLESERTPLDLIAEFYGDAISDIDATLEEFIRTNDLQGPELILVPTGRQVIYYV